MKKDPQEQRPSNRNVITVVILVIVVLMCTVAAITFINALHVFQTVQVLPSSKLIAPEPEATTKTAISLEATQGAKAGPTETMSVKLGTPDSKDPASRPQPPAPVAQATELAGLVPTPANGIDHIEPQNPGWIHKYHVNNTWSGPVNGHGVVVYAGSKSDNEMTGEVHDSAQGVLVLDPMGRGMVTEYLTPTRHGTLTLTASDGMCLRASSSDGTLFSFDLSNRQWSCAYTSSTSLAPLDARSSQIAIDNLVHRRVR